MGDVGKCVTVAQGMLSNVVFGGLRLLRRGDRKRAVGESSRDETREEMGESE